MSTGGFRDISTLSTGRRPRSQTMSDGDDDEMRDVEFTSVSALLEEEDHYFEEENSSKPERQHSRSPSPQGSVRAMVGVKPIDTPPMRPRGGAPRKSILKSLKTDRIKLLSRMRVVFRIFSLVTAGAVLGSTGHILYHYIDTNNLQRKSDGKLIWAKLSLTPTILLLAISSYIFIMDLIFSVISFWPNGRYLKNKIVASVALLHSIISLVCGIVALMLSEEKRNPNSMFWVCHAGHQKPEDLEVMDFGVHCSEQRGSWVAACMCTVAHGLIIPTIVFGFCGGRSKRQKFQDAIIIREPEAKGSVLQRLGDLKEKFTSKH